LLSEPVVKRPLPRSGGGVCAGERHWDRTSDLFGVNVQVIADPAGRLVWISPVLPGARHDLGAAREHGIIDALADAEIHAVADTACKVADRGAATPHPPRLRRQSSTGAGWGCSSRYSTETTTAPTSAHSMAAVASRAKSPRIMPPPRM
jgi:DDE superfamily endonuclease